MHWIDGHIYRGYWTKGIQNGLGLMIFPDGFKKVGFFDKNIFKSNLDSYEEVAKFSEETQIQDIPEHLKQEIKEYLGIYDHIDDEDDEFIN